jgi:hypothetical protein
LTINNWSAVSHISAKCVTRQRLDDEMEGIPSTHVRRRRASHEHAIHRSAVNKRNKARIDLRAPAGQHNALRSSPSTSDCVLHSREVVR